MGMVPLPLPPIAVDLPRSMSLRRFARGGSITAGPVRSKTLAAGSWEISKLAPMAAPAAALAAAGLPPTDRQVYKGFYKEAWALETAEDEAFISAYIANLSAWNW